MEIKDIVLNSLVFMIYIAMLIASYLKGRTDGEIKATMHYDQQLDKLMKDNHSMKNHVIPLTKKVKKLTERV